MDPVRNPFAPGAGSEPPELAGREEVLQESRIGLQRIKRGRHYQSQILLGLRGTGKTVLLNRFAEQAESFDYVVAFIEAPEDRPLAELLFPRLQQLLRKLSMVESAKAKTYQAMRVLRAFASAFRISLGEISLSVDPETGTADSGVLEYDLAELFVSIGQAAASAGRGWVLLIDELQYLSREELSALIVALHRAGQKKLPIIFFGAGLPQIAALSGEAKSYAERLFTFPPIGALDTGAAETALRQPIESEGETISDSAIAEILERTEGYPYFIQEWGYQAWNVAKASPIDKPDVLAGSVKALKRLDSGFFRVRFERLTPSERKYVKAMAALGSGPYRTAEVASVLGETVQSLGPRRARIIHKGVIYSAAHGDIDFTVPLFDDFLRRLEEQKEAS